MQVPFELGRWSIKEDETPHDLYDYMDDGRIERIGNIHDDPNYLKQNSMANNQLQLVTFEQAKKLKEAGFDWPTLHTYCADGTRAVGLNAFNYNAENVFCSAPYSCLALKWMRDVKGLFGAVLHTGYFGHWDGIGNTHNGGVTTFNRCCKTYEEAESAVLDELLKLIEK